ncbi:MAG: 50S ribosomal protein L13 [Methanobacteriota archaeon]|nr:MAG: 50S ribosomal protein L13 [Euryarchaeota archaeon]
MLSLADATTYVFDADGLILGRLASASADILLKAAREDRDDKIIIVNAEKAIISGSRQSVLENYHKKYELNHARKGPFFPRMPDMILKRAVRGMLPYQKKSSGRRALRNLRVEIGCPSHLTGDLPEGHEHGDDSKFRRNLPDRFIRLGDVSANLGAPAHRWTGGDQ